MKLKIDQELPLEIADELRALTLVVEMAAAIKIAFNNAISLSHCTALCASKLRRHALLCKTRLLRQVARREE